MILLGLITYFSARISHYSPYGIIAAAAARTLPLLLKEKRMEKR